MNNLIAPRDDGKFFSENHGVNPDGTTIDSFTIFGERSTGTNFTRALLERNFSKLQPISTFPWEKHSFVATPIARPGTLAIVVLREPVRWMQSLYRNPHQVGHWSVGLSFGEFIRHEWSSVFDGWLFPRQKSFRATGNELMLDRHPLTGEKPRNIVELRNWKVQSYGRVPNLYKNWAFVRYETLCTAPAQFLEMLAQTCNLTGTGNYLTDIEDVSNTASNSKRDKAPYPEVTDADREFIIEQIDLDQEQRFGYLPEV